MKEDILGWKAEVLDKGFVQVVDAMGDDDAICQAARVSFGEGTKTIRENEGLIRYLMRNRHTTPFEMCEIKFQVKMPISVARQWIRHRTANVNEYSTRYSEVEDQSYAPLPSDLRPQSKSNKQGREGEFDEKSQMFCQEMIIGASVRSFEDYDRLIKEGLARESARDVLPLATYTLMFWKIDLHNLFHFLSLRCDPHAQHEIRQYANAIFEIVKEWVPIAAKAFQDYVLEARTFSKKELEFIRLVCSGVVGPLATEDPRAKLDKVCSGCMSDREKRELAEALWPDA